MHRYAFPRVTRDFGAGIERMHESMLSVEAHIHEQLTSDEPAVVRDGLSNVLYWGYARSGYRDFRVERFRRGVSELQLTAAIRAFATLPDPGLREVLKLRMPEFSRMSFVSKVRTFLDPTRFVTLDLKIASLREEPVSTFLQSLKVETSIRVSVRNERLYKKWCDLCRSLAQSGNVGSDVRAVDIERGFFQLIDDGDSRAAAKIVQEWDARGLDNAPLT